MQWGLCPSCNIIEEEFKTRVVDDIYHQHLCEEASKHNHAMIEILKWHVRDKRMTVSNLKFHFPKKKSRHKL